MQMIGGGREVGKEDAEMEVVTNMDVNLVLFILRHLIRLLGK